MWGFWMGVDVEYRTGYARLQSASAGKTGFHEGLTKELQFAAATFEKGLE
jgi:hypothetical protein